ncbi:hypothetical protein ACFOLJ_28195 [Rugamonas sp. CCM 8940]|uniref:hypothetical protein n=1 Tax=Rugamonas sp. CCM 8940 TaxID=2765359 RepID=UPI0018F5D39C|nr:hypothetical protein [Rugamonas sp. CCM 8940]MBJ7312846.1 hypothetical protein [Rugamonas sp. CCM 8940]
MPIYVQHEVLGRIPDVFNAEAIWQAPGLALFSRRPLLRDLLERSPREHKGRAATRCFSHVTLMLPQEEVDDDYHLTRGARARDLAQTLTALHQKDFGDLLGADQVRYDVIGAEAVEPGQIEVKFGHAVYLPAADEKILYNVSVSRDSAIWHPVCPIYPNQRLALIGGDDGEASFAAAGWPFGADGAILIINDGPDSPPAVQMRPKDAFDCRYDPRGGHYTIKSKHGGEARLLLKISRVGTAAEAPSAADQFQSIPALAGAAASSAAQAAIGTPSAAAVPPANAAMVMPAPRAGKTGAGPAVWQSRGGAPATLDQTAVPIGHQPLNQPGESDSTYAPLAQQRVSLVALALPRLSRYRDTGARALELPFNQALTLGGAGTPAISFVVDAADQLHACTAAGRQRIAAPASFTPVDGRAIALLAAAPAMAERYCALLCLPQPVAAAVAAGARFNFGRSSAMLAALRVLDSPRFLQREDGDGTGGADGASADRIGLSRNAFSFEASAQGFKIGRLAASQALYHLDEQLAFVATIGEASAEAPYLLPPGHHLVAGHYVLRFDA